MACSYLAVHGVITVSRARRDMAHKPFVIVLVCGNSNVAPSRQPVKGGVCEGCRTKALTHLSVPAPG